MSDKIRVKSSRGGCWMVLRGDYVLDIYPPHMWTFAFREARREAIWNNLRIVGVEVA